MEKIILEYGPSVGVSVAISMIVISWLASNLRKYTNRSLAILYMQLIETDTLTTRHAVEAHIFDDIQTNPLSVIKDL